LWIDRIQGTKRNVEVWQTLLAVRALVLPPTEDIDTWLTFASLCRKSGRISQGHSTLIKLLQLLKGEQTIVFTSPVVSTIGYVPY